MQTRGTFTIRSNSFTSNKTDLPINPPNLRQYFKLIKGERKLPELLANVIRRTRRDIIRWLGYDAETHDHVDPANYRVYLDNLAAPM